MLALPWLALGKQTWNASLALRPLLRTDVHYAAVYVDDISFARAARFAFPGVHITELQATTTSLREQFAALAEETNDARAFAQGRGKELEEQIQRLTKQNLEAGLREQSLSSHDTPSGITALSEMQSELQRLRKSSDHINAVSDDLEASKKELVGLIEELDQAATKADRS